MNASIESITMIGKLSSSQFSTCRKPRTLQQGQPGRNGAGIAKAFRDVDGDARCSWDYQSEERCTKQCVDVTASRDVTFDKRNSLYSSQPFSVSLSSFRSDPNPFPSAHKLFQPCPARSLHQAHHAIPRSSHTVVQTYSSIATPRYPYPSSEYL